MKKYVFIGLLVFAFMALSLSLVSAHGSGPFDGPNPGDYDDPYARPCHGSWAYHQDNQPSYDWLYHQLTPAEQAEVDVLLSERIQSVDMSDMTSEEKTDAIQAMKDDLIDDIMDTYFDGGRN